MTVPKSHLQHEFPAVKTLQCGPISALIHDGFLRDIKYNGEEVLRGIYFSVRDHLWREVPPVSTRTEIIQESNTFNINITQHYNADSVALQCQIAIKGHAHGEVSYSFSACPTGECRTNRLGLCVLHGSQVSGNPLSITTADGGTVTGSFPSHIAAHQPYTDILALRWQPAVETEATLYFKGDSFEMEDQRNWSDDSFKTYCTPLRLPKPVQRHEGDCVSQKVLLNVQLVSPASSVVVDGASDKIGTINVRNYSRCPLPLIGLTLPPQHQNDVLTDDILRLGITHVWLQIDVRAPEWRSSLVNQVDRFERQGIKLALEVDGIQSERTLHEFLEAVRDRSSVLLVILYSNDSVITDEMTISVAKNALIQNSWSIKLAGGTRGHYAQLNRSSVNQQGIDSVLFAITPTVHMSDLMSIAETLNAQPQLVADVTRYMKRDVSMHVGPITMLPRFNADFPISKVNSIIDRPDALYRTPFYAAWFIGSINALSHPGVCSLTYSFHGALNHGSDVVPAPRASQVLAQIEPQKLQYVLDVETSDVAIQCLALHDHSRGHLHLFVSNVSDVPRTIEIHMPYGSEASGAVLFTETGREQLDLIQHASLVSLHLPQCGVALVSALFRS